MNQLLTSQRVRSILRKSMTTKADLEELLRMLDIDASVDWLLDFDKNEPTQILNLGNGIIGGTHWVAVDNVKKRYFDSFGINPPDIIPDEYEWLPLQIQDINYGHCGQYAALFLYYSKIDEVDKFYNLFKKGV